MNVIISSSTPLPSPMFPFRIHIQPYPCRLTIAPHAELPHATPITIPSPVFVPPLFLSAQPQAENIFSSTPGAHNPFVTIFYLVIEGWFVSVTKHAMSTPKAMFPLGAVLRSGDNGIRPPNPQHRLCSTVDPLRTRIG